MTTLGLVVTEFNSSVTDRQFDPTGLERLSNNSDATFEGRNGPLVKFNPMANWSSKDVWDYIRTMEVPYNELHDRGFVSIGCEPCTRPVLPGQHEREGRWWWEEATQKECGLHASNMITSSSAE